MLSNKEIEHFISEGFVRIDHAFSKEVADKAVDILWNDIPFERDRPQTWSEPVVRLGMYGQEPFIDSVNTSALRTAYDQLVGAGRWLPCGSVGTFVVRFPSPKEPNDTGKHVDAGFAGADPENYFEWRVNVRSQGRALLMLVLYSDVSENDAPTIIYPGSHIDVARLLYSEGEAGLSFMELAGKLGDLPMHAPVYATGKAGTVYLCHPFLVHVAQAHNGLTPKFMAQPPLLLKSELMIDGATEPYMPVEQAIRLALE